MPDAQPSQQPDHLAAVRKLRQILQGVDFFNRLKIEELELLVDSLRRRQVPRGEILMSQGEKKADAFYMIGSGRCSVWVKKGAAMAKVADLGHDNYFGEKALVTSEPRAATVRAETDCELYVLTRDDFDAILMKNPGIAQEIKFHVSQYKK